MKLNLSGIAVDCIIGDLPHERECLQRLTVDVGLEIGSAAAESDDLADTVDYAGLSRKIRDDLVAAKCRMIERAAKVAYEACMSFGGGIVVSACVAVRKAGSVPGMEFAEAVYDGS